MEILFGVSAKQCRDHPEKSFPPTNFELLPKALQIPMVEFATSRSRFGDYIKWSYIAKVLQIPSKTAPLEILLGVFA